MKYIGLVRFWTMNDVKLIFESIVIGFD